MCDRHLGLIAIALIAVSSRGTNAAVIQARPVALSGQRAPGTPEGVVFDDGYAFFPSIFTSGQTEFLAFVTGPSINEDNDTGIWSEASGTLALVAREGDAAPGAGAGMSFGQILRHQSSSTGHIVLQATLIGPGVDESNKLGIWSNSSGELVLVARTGSPAPGVSDVAVFADFDEALINRSGQVAFIARLAGPSVDAANESGIWSEASGTLALVTRGGQSHAPGSQRLPFRRFHFLAFNDAGQVAFSASLSGGLETSGIWVGSNTLIEIAVASEIDPAAGDPAPGAPLASFRSLISPIEIDDQGRTVFFADLAGVDAGNDSGIWSSGPNGVVLVAREGDAAPGTSAGTVFDDFERAQPGAPALNGGHVTFQALLRGPGVNETNDQGCWSRSSAGEVNLIARYGDIVPDSEGAVFSGIGYPSLTNTGQIVFGAVVNRLGSEETDLAICIRDADGKLRVAVKDSDTARLSGSSATFFGVGQGGGEATGGESGRAASLNDQGQLVFTAFLFDGRRGVFVTPADEESVGEGDSAADATEDTAESASAQCGACGTGASTLAPLTILGLLTVSRRRSRRLRND